MNINFWPAVRLSFREIKVTGDTCPAAQELSVSQTGSWKEPEP